MNTTASRSDMKNSVPQPNVSGEELRNIQAVADHLTRIHNEFSEKLRILQQTVEKNQRIAIFFSRALYSFVKPFRGIGFLLSSILFPVRNAKILRDFFYIRKSNAFDTAFYMRVYPDVTASAFNPIMHYCQYGWKGKRNPSSKFNTATYLAKNPDVEASDMNPFYHYLRYGRKEEWRKCTETMPPQKTVNETIDFRRIQVQLNQEKIRPETLDEIIDNIRKELYDVLQ